MALQLAERSVEVDPSEEMRGIIHLARQVLLLAMEDYREGQQPCPRIKTCDINSSEAFLRGRTYITTARGKRMTMLELWTTLAGIEPHVVQRELGLPRVDRQRRQKRGR